VTLRKRTNIRRGVPLRKRTNIRRNAEQPHPVQQHTAAGRTHGPSGSQRRGRQCRRAASGRTCPGRRLRSPTSHRYKSCRSRANSLAVHPDQLRTVLPPMSSTAVRKRRGRQCRRASSGRPCRGRRPRAPNSHRYKSCPSSATSLAVHPDLCSHEQHCRHGTRTSDAGCSARSLLGVGAP
jgi:hypothetical protein